MSKLRFGFIGCGSIAQYHADVVLALGHSIVGVSAREGSLKIEDFSNKNNIENKYSDYTQLVTDQKPDALVISLPWDVTHELIEDIIQLGVPCLIEKPIALDSSKLTSIIEHTTEFHQQVMIGYNRRFYDFIPLVKKVLEEKTINSIECNFPENVDRLVEKYGESLRDYVLLYMSSHWFDLLMYLMGDLDIVALKQSIDSSSHLINGYNGLIESKRLKVPIHLQMNFNEPSNTEIKFNFKDSIYELKPIEQLTIYEGLEVHEPSDQSPLRRYEPKVKEVVAVDGSYKPGFINQMQDFIDSCVLKTKGDMGGCNLQQALKVTSFCEQLRGVKNQERVVV